MHVGRHTFPSVTVLNVSIPLNFVSKLGAASRKPITTCTIVVMACLSCPCFLLSSSTCSFSSAQSPESLQIVTIATITRDVEGRSDAWRVCFSRDRSFSTAACVWPFCRIYVLVGSGEGDGQVGSYRCESFGLRNSGVDFFGEVLLGFDDCAVRHGGGVG